VERMRLEDKSFGGYEGSYESRSNKHNQLWTFFE
jgi:hypothetical protein